MRKKVFMVLLAVCCLLGLRLGVSEANAAQYVALFVDGNGGTFHISEGMDLYSGEDRAAVGDEVSSVFYIDDEPVSIDQEFIGWYVYDKSTNAQIAGTGLLTTAQVNDYIIPGHDIEFVAQWKPKTGAPITNITYAAVYNGTGRASENVKVTVVGNGVSYSGYGFVSIPKSIYSAWTGTVEVIWEPSNGEYIMADGSWTDQTFRSEGSANSFVREKNACIAVSTTGKGQDRSPLKSELYDLYYRASFAAPEVSIVQKTTAGQVIDNSDVIPATYSVETEMYKSGSTYDAAVQAAQNACGTSNVVVVDIELKDESGASVHQLSDYVGVRVDIPADYTIQPGMTVVVYYLNGDGVLEECKTTCYADDPNDRYVIFETNHFSVYVLAEAEIPVVEEPEVTPEAPEETPEMPEETPEVPEQPNEQEAPAPQKGDPFLICAAIGIVAVLVVILFAVRKKKK